MKGPGFGPVGKMPGRNQNTGVLIFLPPTGWPWTGHLLSLSCCSFWQMKVVGPNSLILQDSVVSLAQPSLGSCGPAVTLLSWSGEAPHDLGGSGSRQPGPKHPLLLWNDLDLDPHLPFNQSRPHISTDPAGHEHQFPWM